MNAADHVASHLEGRGTAFSTFNPNRANRQKFILGGLPPSREFDRFAGEGCGGRQPRQIKRNIVGDGMRVVTLLPMWVITVPKRTENIENLNNVTGILKFVIRIKDYRPLIASSSASDVGILATRQNSVTLKIAA